MSSTNLFCNLCYVTISVSIHVKYTTFYTPTHHLTLFMCSYTANIDIISGSI